jgi:hypothetical protein
MSNLFTAVSVEQQEIVAGGRRSFKLAEIKTIKSFNRNNDSFNGTGNTVIAGLQNVQVLVK